MSQNFLAIAQWVHDITLWILVILSVLSLAFILERFFTLGKIRRQSREIADRLREILTTGNLSDLDELAKDRNSLEGRAANLGLRHVRDRGLAGIDEIFSSFTSIERPNLDRYLGFLATVGSNAPFIGLLGTVFGIMDAFRALSQSQGDANVVMAGISQALIATAAGLMVAIPAVISYNYFQKQVKGVIGNLNSVRDLCIAYAKSTPKKV